MGSTRLASTRSVTDVQFFAPQDEPEEPPELPQATITLRAADPGLLARFADAVEGLTKLAPGVEITITSEYLIECFYGWEVLIDE